LKSGRNRGAAFVFGVAFLDRELQFHLVVLVHIHRHFATIRKALADELLFGRLADGGEVTVDMDEHDKVKLEFAVKESNAKDKGSAPIPA
jgi:hypothetical protein